jgi:hypothetical protein
MKHKCIQSIDNVYEDDVKMVRFRLNKGWDYVWITYHDEKGFLSITSSYGNYSYIWSAMGEGTTLRQFFLTANNQYLSDKFFHDRHKEKYAFDLDLAFVEMKKDLFENRRNGGFSSEQAREVFNDIKDWQEWSDSGMSEERFYTEYFDRREISKWNQEPWESNYGRKLSTAYMVLYEEIVPMIRDHFKMELLNVSQKVTCDN